MKYTKRLLKDSFEKGKIGIEYLKSLADDKTAPVLFVKGDGSDDFLEWIHQLFNYDSIVVDKKTFDKEYDNISERIILVEDVKKLRDSTTEAAMKCRKAGKNVIVSLSQHPKILDYIVDPAFKLIEIMEFNPEMHEEIEEVRKKML